MKNFFKIVAFVLLFFSVSLNAASLTEIKNRGYIKIGVFGDKPPFGYIDENGKNQGYDVYFAKRVAKELFGDESKVEFIILEAANRVDFLRADKLDLVLANFTHTKDRARVVDFGLPYMKVSIGVASKNGEVKSLDDLKNKTLLLNKGTTADIYFTKNHKNIKSLKFDQNTETFAALLDGRGEALAHDNTLLFAWVKSHPEFKVGIEAIGDNDVIAPAVKKGNKELLNWINDLIIKLGDENFFHKAYDETIKPIYGDDIDPNSVVIESGRI
ncbi:transporter substrate-binding domain-containing protein [Campylobacter sp. FMV-PI01]|uniref:Transporter substrate-binding domain-containing protein n=1 Tax=Campylobacter portucalensis TaxID=2608384 RepID=A0A6L5WJE4_9BACT|nr:transporter substrate-binding domain-containing protein [Campylobacter portucalensis]